MRNSQVSQVSEPSPQGVLRVEIFSFFVGKGIGPRSSTPAFCAISLICVQTASKSLKTWLSSLILACFKGNQFFFKTQTEKKTGRVSKRNSETRVIFPLIFF